MRKPGIAHHDRHIRWAHPGPILHDFNCPTKHHNKPIENISDGNGVTGDQIHDTACHKSSKQEMMQ
jgi:hypothetical protein